MPRFSFEARGVSGDLVRGVEVALDEFALDRQLADNDLLLVSSSVARRRAARGSSTRALVDLCYHLAVVSESGIPLIEGLRDLAASDHPLRDVLADVGHKVEAGSTLSDALAEHPRHFPELMQGLVRAGEESGSLDRVLQDLATHLEWREDLTRQIRSAATYPTLVLVGIIGLGGILGAWVLPRFLQIFSELGAKLPPTTRALVWLHAFFSTHWMLVGVALLAAAGAWVLAWRHPTSRAGIDAALLRVPLLGSLLLMIEMSRFSHNLGILVSGGMPILRALAMVEDVVQNRTVRAALARGRERVEQGATLTDGMGQSDLLPPLVMRMMKVGEVSGRLEESLSRVAAFYDREVPVIVGRALAFFNAFVLVALGAVLVVIALSIFAPLYQAMGDLSAT